MIRNAKKLSLFLVFVMMYLSTGPLTAQRGRERWRRRRERTGGQKTETGPKMEKAKAAAEKSMAAIQEYHVKKSFFFAKYGQDKKIGKAYKAWKPLAKKFVDTPLDAKDHEPPFIPMREKLHGQMWPHEVKMGDYIKEKDPEFARLWRNYESGKNILRKMGNKFKEFKVKIKDHKTFNKPKHRGPGGGRRPKNR